MKNLVYIITGIILSKSVELSDISEKLKDDFSEETEDSKIKRIYRFFSTSPINADYVYSFFIEEMFKDLKSNGFNIKNTWTGKITYFTN